MFEFSLWCCKLSLVRHLTFLTTSNFLQESIYYDQMSFHMMNHWNRTVCLEKVKQTVFSQAHQKSVRNISFDLFSRLEKSCCGSFDQIFGVLITDQLLLRVSSRHQRMPRSGWTRRRPSSYWSNNFRHHPGHLPAVWSYSHRTDTFSQTRNVVRSCQESTESGEYAGVDMSSTGTRSLGEL